MATTNTTSRIITNARMVSAFKLDEDGELVRVGVGDAIVCVDTKVLWGMLTGDSSGYLSSTLGLLLTVYEVLPIPELPISVAFGYLVR